MRASRRWLITGVLVSGVIGLVVLLYLFSGLHNPVASETPQNSFPLGGDSLSDLYPGHGNTGYDVDSYNISVTWDASARSLNGTARIRARTTDDLSGLYLDFYGQITKAEVNGHQVTAQRSDQLNWLVSTGQLSSGTDFELTVEYAAPLSNCPKKSFNEKGSEVVIADEPEGPACWYPGNHHPSDAATYDVTLTTDDSVTGIASGSLMERSGGKSRFVITHPAPSYTTLVAFGPYEVTTVPFRDGTSTYAVSTQLRQRDSVKAALAASPEIVSGLERFLGPYPADAAGGIAAGVRFPSFAALETSGGPLYATGATTPTVMAHELSHMWFGNRVTLKSWRDMWLNEAMASYASWVYTADGKDRAQDKFDRTLEEFAERKGFWTTDLHRPQNEASFEYDYSRGPMTMHALRNVMGDEKFFPMWKEWAQLSGPHTVDDFIAHAERHHGSSLTEFFKAWIDGTESMPRTKAFGFR